MLHWGAGSALSYVLPFLEGTWSPAGRGQMAQGELPGAEMVQMLRMLCPPRLRSSCSGLYFAVLCFFLYKQTSNEAGDGSLPAGEEGVPRQPPCLQAVSG